MVKITGKKIGMTHIFTEEGKRCPVTVIEAETTFKDSGSDMFKLGDFVDITGISKGKGFQGGMKRWNWSGTPKTHGSTSHRRVGSIGSSAAPSRVFKGRHLPGHMGNCRVTIQNLRVVKLDKEHNLLAVKGAVPGHINSRLIIKKAKKKPGLKAEDDSKKVTTEEAKKVAAEKTKAKTKGKTEKAQK